MSKYSRDDTGFFMHKHLPVPEKLFEQEATGKVFKHLPRDPANINAMIQTQAFS